MLRWVRHIPFLKKDDWKESQIKSAHDGGWPMPWSEVWLKKDVQAYKVKYAWTYPPTITPPTPPETKEYFVGDTVTPEKITEIVGNYYLDGWYDGDNKITEFEMPSHDVLLTGEWKECMEFMAYYYEGDFPDTVENHRFVPLMPDSDYIIEDPPEGTVVVDSKGYTWKFNGWDVHPTGTVYHTLPKPEYHCGAENPGSWSKVPAPFWYQKRGDTLYIRGDAAEGYTESDIFNDLGANVPDLFFVKVESPVYTVSDKTRRGFKLFNDMPNVREIYLGENFHWDWVPIGDGNREFIAFTNCPNLKHIYVSQEFVDNVQKLPRGQINVPMFEQCYKLHNWHPDDPKDNTYALIDDGTNHGYFEGADTPYKVTYEYVGPEIPEDAPEVIDSNVYRMDDEVTVKADPVLAGYQFNGWIATDATVISGKFKIEHNTHFIGTWTYVPSTNSVVYSYTGLVPQGAPAPYVPESHQSREIITVKPVPTMTGYKFNGWVSSDVEIVDGQFEMPRTLVRLTGSWELLPTEQMVSYAYLGDVPPSAPWVPASEIHMSGDEVEVQPVPELYNYTFNGWNCNKVVVYDNKFTMPREDITFTGTWTYTPTYYTVRYLYEGATPPGVPTPPASEPHLFGESLLVATNPELRGFEFSGWTTADVTVSSGKFTMPENNVTFRGRWEHPTTEYTVTYKWEGVVPPDTGVPPAPENHLRWDIITVPTFVSQDYIFNGWTCPDVTIVDNQFEMPGKNITLTGTWSSKPGTVVYSYYGYVPPEAPEAWGAVESTDTHTVLGKPTPTSVQSADGNKYIFNTWEEYGIGDTIEVKPNQVINITGRWLMDNATDTVYSWLETTSTSTQTLHLSSKKLNSNYALYNRGTIEATNNTITTMKVENKVILPGNVKNWFSGFKALTSIENFELFDMSQVTNAQYLFYNTGAEDWVNTTLDFTAVNLGYNTIDNTESYVNIYCMFRHGIMPENIILPATNLENPAALLHDCKGVKNVSFNRYPHSRGDYPGMFKSSRSTLSTFNLMCQDATDLRVLDMTEMKAADGDGLSVYAKDAFYGCTHLMHIYANIYIESYFKAVRQTGASEGSDKTVFTLCNSLHNFNGTTNAKYAILDNGSNNGYFELRQ